MNTIIPCIYENQQKEKNHYYVWKNGKKGIINLYGNTIIPCKYDEITPQNNRYVVKTGDKYGVINTYGNTVLPCRFSKIEFLSNGNYVGTEGSSKQLYNAYGSLLSDYSNKNVIYSTDNAVE